MALVQLLLQVALPDQFKALLDQELLTITRETTRHPAMDAFYLGIVLALFGLTLLLLLTCDRV